MSRMKRNIIANMLGRACNSISVYIFIPLYLNFLGLEAYGIVGFFAVLQSILALTDAGLTAAFSRELASAAMHPDASRNIPDFVRTIEVIYLVIAASVVVCVAALAGPMARGWLNSESLSSHTIETAVQLMGIVIAFQFFGGLYQGGLIGLQRQVLSNLIQAGSGLLRGGGAVLVLWLISPTLQAFFAWQILATALYCITARQSLWSSLPRGTEVNPRPRFSLSVLARIWRYAAGIAGITLLSTVLNQTDKVIVSKMLSLQAFACYSLAALLSQMPMILASAISTAVCPRMIALVSLHDQRQLTHLYHRSCQMVSVLAFPPCVLLAVFSRELITIWTRSVTTAEQTWMAASILLCGSIVMSALMVPYQLALSHGYTRLNLIIGAVSIVVMTPLEILLIQRYGILGGALSWLLLCGGIAPPFIYFLHKRFMPGETLRWLLQDNGRPLAVSAMCIAAGRLLLPAHCAEAVVILIVTLTGLIAVSASWLSLPGSIGAITTAYGLRALNSHSVND